MADIRTTDEKLMAVAMQDASPAERDNARAILRRAGLWPPPVVFGDGPRSEPDLRPDMAYTMPGYVFEGGAQTKVVYSGRTTLHRARRP